jgi:hypothetical protein
MAMPGKDWFRWEGEKIVPATSGPFAFVYSKIGDL